MRGAAEGVLAEIDQSSAAAIRTAVGDEDGVRCGRSFTVKKAKTNRAAEFTRAIAAVVGDDGVTSRRGSGEKGCTVGRGTLIDDRRASGCGDGGVAGCYVQVGIKAWRQGDVGDRGLARVCPAGEEHGSLGVGNDGVGQRRRRVISGHGNVAVFVNGNVASAAVLES